MLNSEFTYFKEYVKVNPFSLKDNMKTFLNQLL